MHLLSVSLRYNAGHNTSSKHYFLACATYHALYIVLLLFEFGHAWRRRHQYRTTREPMERYDEETYPMWQASRPYTVHELPYVNTDHSYATVCTDLMSWWRPLSILTPTVSHNSMLNIVPQLQAGHAFWSAVLLTTTRIRRRRSLVDRAVVIDHQHPCFMLVSTSDFVSVQFFSTCSRRLPLSNDQLLSLLPFCVPPVYSVWLVADLPQ